MDQDRRQAKEQAKALPMGQRIKYYLGYYKLHILAVTLVLVTVFMMVRAIVLRKEPVLYFGVMNSSSCDSDYLEQEMVKTLELSKKETIVVHKDLSSTPVYGAQDMTVVYLAANELNIIFTDETGVKYMVDSEACIPFKDWCDVSTYTEWKERGYSYNGEEVALNIEGLAVKDKLGLAEETNYVIIIAKPGREEYTAKFIEWLYKL